MMKPYFSVVIFLFLSIPVCAQDDLLDELDALTEVEKNTSYLLLKP